VPPDPGTVGARLDAALSLGDPVPVFQPIIDLATGMITGYEALSRFPHLPGAPVDEVFAPAHRTGRGFQVEITENELVADAGQFRSALEELRDRGAQIAVDDVGEGYAGLQRVMSIRPDVLKLDRSLVSGVDSRPDVAALLEAVVRFAGRVGAQVCAEGVETEEELALLATSTSLTARAGSSGGRRRASSRCPRSRRRAACRRGRGRPAYPGAGPYPDRAGHRRGRRRAVLPRPRGALRGGRA
jgi:EAL domain-containing protein (putative c-di-GMP-specific phosphodiesterase class I)